MAISLLIVGILLKNTFTH